MKQSNGKFVARIYGVDDNPKNNFLFGKEMPPEFGTLWTAPIYPEKDNIREAIASALDLYEKVQNEDWNNIEPGKSLAAGFNDADLYAILDWNKHMEELVAMEQIKSLINNHIPATQVHLETPITKAQKEWLNKQLKKSDYCEQIRLHYYFGTALKDECEVDEAFNTLSSAILQQWNSSRKSLLYLRSHRKPGPLSYL